MCPNYRTRLRAKDKRNTHCVKHVPSGEEPVSDIHTVNESVCLHKTF